MFVIKFPSAKEDLFLGQIVQETVLRSYVHRFEETSFDEHSFDISSLCIAGTPGVINYCNFFISEDVNQNLLILSRHIINWN